MKIGILKESTNNDYRVACTPNIVDSFIKKGLSE
jgi:alanine dehydrogenase